MTKVVYRMLYGLQKEGQQQL